MCGMFVYILRSIKYKINFTKKKIILFVDLINLKFENEIDNFSFFFFKFSFKLISILVLVFMLNCLLHCTQYKIMSSSHSVTHTIELHKFIIKAKFYEFFEYYG